MKKKLTLLFASIASLGLLAGCGIGGSENGQEYDDEGNKIVKIMFHVDSKSKEGVAYKARINEFNKAYADQHIKAAATFKARAAGGADYQQSLATMKTEGTLPDIITFDAPNCASYAKVSLLHDISSFYTQEEKEDFLSTNMYQGKLYGLPIQESSAGFFYNKKIFAAAGIDVSAYTVDNPWTFDQFKDVCRKLKNYGGSNPEFKAVDMRLDATKDETATYLLYPFIYAAGGEFVDSTGLYASGYYNSQKSKNGFQFLLDLVNEGYTSYTVGATSFFTGKTGMYLSSGWTIRDLDSREYSEFQSRDDWGILPYPQSETKASATGSWSYAVTNNGNNDKTAAKELLKWMTSTDSATGVTNATGMIPARKSCNPGYAAGSPEKVLLDQLAKTGRQRPVTVAYPQFSQSFSNIIYSMRNDGVENAVNAATRELESALERYR